MDSPNLARVLTSYTASAMGANDRRGVCFSALSSRKGECVERVRSTARARTEG